MPRFYFHLHDFFEVTDEDGKDLPNAAAARAYAIDLAKFEIAEHARVGHIVLTHRIDIENEQRKLLGSVHFRDLLKIEG